MSDAGTGMGHLHLGELLAGDPACPSVVRAASVATPAGARRPPAASAGSGVARDGARPTGRQVTLLGDRDQLPAEARDEPDWAAVYLSVREPMFRAVWRVLRRHRSYCGECGEDIVMKAFHELMRKGLDGVTSPVGLAVTIAHRRALDVVGRSSRETPCAAFDDVEDDELLAEELLRREELFTHVTSCLDRLPDRQRIAFVETVMKDRPVKERRWRRRSSGA